MPDKTKRNDAKAQPPMWTDDLPSPLNFLLDTSEPNLPEMQTLSSLFLMSEAIAKPYRPKTELPSPSIPHAAAEELKASPPLEDFGALFGLLTQIREWSEADPRRQEFLDRLRDSVGAAGNLDVLFQSLFPQARPRPWADADGKSLLTPRQKDVLREVGKDHSAQEIAKTLKIKVSTVNMHLLQVYKKLGCNRPMQAVARAISLGYLETDALAFIEDAGGCRARDFHTLGYRFSSIAGQEHYLNEANLTPIAEFGLLLLALSGCAIRELHHGTEPAARKQPVICELNRNGDIVRTFGENLPGLPMQVAIAPPHAVRAGFTPGNLYVACLGIPQQGLNLSAIAELTPEGEFVRAFSGGADQITRLSLAMKGLAFASDGRLLVTSECLLEFRDGGDTVRRFAPNCCGYVCVEGQGRVYQQLHSGLGCSVAVFEAGGKLLRTFHPTQPGDRYCGIAVTTQGEVAVAYFEDGQGSIIMHNTEGHRLRRFAVSGMNVDHLALAATDLLYVPCYEEASIKVFTPQGKFVQGFDLRKTLLPCSVTVTEEGHLWVCGTIGGGVETPF